MSAVLTLTLAACGGGDDGEGLADPTGNTRILEGTIDDSMIDLVGSEQQFVRDEGGAVEGNDQRPPEKAAPAADKPESAPSEPAESQEPSDSTEDE